MLGAHQTETLPRGAMGGEGLNDLPLALRVYFGLVVATTAALAVALSSALPAQLPDLPLALLFAGLLFLSKRYHIQLAPKLKISTDTAVLFATALIFDPSLAVPIVASGSLVSSGVSRRPWFIALFNAGQAALSTVLAALAFGALSPGRPDQLADITHQVPGYLLAALVMYSTNAFLVDMAVSLRLGLRPFAGSLRRHRSVLPHHIALFLLGLFPAITVRSYPWTIALVAAPTIIVYVALRDMVRLRVQTREAVEALADMVDLRDPYTHGHSQRVASYSVLIARRMGLPPDEVEVIRAAARVHDIGKIAIPDHVLRKPDRLTEDEFREMQRHQETGAWLLQRFPDFDEGRKFVWCHHERPDGGGYGRGLKGSEIPLGAAIIAVADSFDAMTSDRPYRSALPVEKAVAELRRYRGRQWDARVVDAFLEVLQEESRAQVCGRLASAGA